MTETPTTDAGAVVRRLMRRVPRVALGTALARGDGAPYVSLAMVALDHDATPVLLLSDLADHTRNLKVDPRVSLLFDGTGRAAIPLAEERATIQGRVVPTTDGTLRARYLARHPDAAGYVDFRDFSFYKVEIEKAHLVAGFGRIHWMDGAAVILRTNGMGALREAEAGILAHMSEEHADVVQLCAWALLGEEGRDWRMVGIDPEGADLRRDGTGLTARLPFARIVRSPEEVRAELVRLAKRARERAAERSNP